MSNAAIAILKARIKKLDDLTATEKVWLKDSEEHAKIYRDNIEKYSTEKLELEQALTAIEKPKREEFFS